MDSRAYTSALLLNKHCDAMLSLEEQRLDRQKRSVYNRVFREKEQLLNEYIHINVRTPSPTAVTSDRYRTEPQSARGSLKRSSCASTADRPRRAASAKAEFGSRQKPAGQAPGFRPQSALPKPTANGGDSQNSAPASSWNAGNNHSCPHTVAPGRPTSSTTPRRHPSRPKSPKFGDTPDTPRTTATMDERQTSETSRPELRDPAGSAASDTPFHSSRASCEAPGPAAGKVPTRPALKITVNRADSSPRCYTTPGYVPKASGASSSPARPSAQVRRLSVASPENVKLAEDKRDRDLATSGQRRKSAMEVRGVFARETEQYGEDKGVSKHDSERQHGAANQNNSQDVLGTCETPTKGNKEDLLAFYRRALMGASSIPMRPNSKTGIREKGGERVSNSAKSLDTTRSQCHSAVEKSPRHRNMINKEEEPLVREQEETEPRINQQGQQEEEEEPAKKAVRQMTLDPKLMLPLTARRYQAQKTATIVPKITVTGHRATMYPNANAKVGRVVTLERRAIGWLERSAAILSSLEKILCTPRDAPVPVASPSKTLPWTPRLNMTSPFGMMSLADRAARSGDVTEANSVPSSARPFTQAGTASSSDGDDSDDDDVVLVPQTIQRDPEEEDSPVAKSSTPEKHQHQKLGHKMRGGLIANQRQGQGRRAVPATSNQPRQGRMSMGVPFVKVRQHQAAAALAGRHSKHH